MTTEATLSISFPVRRSNDATGFTYVEGCEAAVYAGSMATAKSKLRPIVEEKIKTAFEQVGNYNQCVIGCNDGTVLVCQFRYGNWGYEIAGAGRKHFSSCMGYATFAEVCVRAFRHAEGSYSGVAWQVGAPSDETLAETRERLVA